MLLVFDADGGDAGDAVGKGSEMLVVGDDTWTDLGAISGKFPYAVTVDNEVYVQGKLHTFV